MRSIHPIQEKRKRVSMILADKIIELRKKTGLSQEDPWKKLNVSRQLSPNGGKCNPSRTWIRSLKFILDLFSISTDYLLKDEIEEMWRHRSPSRITILPQGKPSVWRKKQTRLSRICRIATFAAFRPALYCVRRLHCFFTGPAGGWKAPFRSSRRSVSALFSCCSSSVSGPPSSWRTVDGERFCLFEKKSYWMPTV